MATKYPSDELVAARSAHKAAAEKYGPASSQAQAAARARAALEMAETAATAARRG